MENPRGGEAGRYVAAFVVLLLLPEAVVHPSFQMSFAATLALVARYQGA